MRLPRMTTRRWMVVVAIIGLAMGGIVGGFRMGRRRDDFLKRARYHRSMEMAYRTFRPTPTWVMTPRVSETTAHYATMANKYRYAAQYPWLPVEPDPPEPQ